MDEQNQTQQTPQSVNSEAQSSPQMHGNSKKSMFVPVGLGILVILVAVGAYLLGTNQSKTLVQNTVQTTTPSPVPTIDETTNWKTYTNTKYGFEFKYPENLYLRTDATDESIGFLEILNRNDSQKLIVGVQKNPSNLALKDFVEKNRPIPDDRRNISYEVSKVNGYDALITRYEIPCLGLCVNSKASKHFVISVKGDKSIINFSLDTKNTEGNTKEDEEYLDQILSTFRFTN